MDVVKKQFKLRFTYTLFVFVKRITEWNYAWKVNIAYSLQNSTSCVLSTYHEIARYVEIYLDSCS